ncbi:hypothetical protein P692DRAFT_20694881, partial [Suillus brevipes Sb2]
DTEDDNKVHAQQEHPQGSNNYTSSDIKVLLDMVCQELPLSQHGWHVVHIKLTYFARDEVQADGSLIELQLVKTTKPTGDGVCPPEVTHAHCIDQLINEHAGTHNLDDMDFDD